MLSGEAVKLTMEDWEKLNTRWKEVDDQVRRWQLKLDTNLPGKLGNFGQWLYDAEALLQKESDLLAKPDENLQQIADTLHQHKVGEALGIT